MLSGAATVSLAELAPPGDTRRAALLATLSQAGGSAAGVLLCGVLAQWAPAPEVTPFAVGMIICALAATGLLFVPETAEGPQVPGQVPGRGQSVDAQADDDVPALCANLGTRLSTEGARQHRIHATARALPPW